MHVYVYMLLYLKNHQLELKLTAKIIKNYFMFMKPSPFSCFSIDNHLWLLVHLLGLYIMSVSGKVFVSIDCGASGSFTDENTIVWNGDSDLISNGVAHAVHLNYTVSRVMDTLRAFTTRKKNCYSIEATQGEKVLVRAGFNYGNYDRKSNPPNFDLHFDGNFWITVNSSEVKVYEAIYVVKRKVTSVCVAQTNPNQIPFISTLEVRSLDLQVYDNMGTHYALFTNVRTAYAVNESIRFPKDPYDRIWVPALNGNGLINVTNNETLINVDVPDNPPPAVLENGISVPNRTQGINLGLSTIIDYPARYPIYINWYFSEVIKLNPGEIRSFRIFMDDVAFSLPIVPRFGNVTQYFITNLTATLDTNFSLMPIGDSTYPPLINAAELFSISDPLTDGTNNDDVEGLSSLQLAFRGLQEWGGDPCLPAPYSWEWIVCNNDPAPRVTSLVLNSFNLSGSLPDFSNMNALEIIDLHNNSLTGPIPSFMGTLPNLKQLNLADNQFSGSIPRTLSRNSKLNLSVAGNPLLCSTNDKSCPGSGNSKTSKLPIILGITIPVLLVFCFIMGVFIIRHKRKASVPLNSGNASHRATDATTSGTRGITQFDNSNDNGDNDEERFYSSPAPLLVGGQST